MAPLNILDLMLVAQFGFHADFPGWLWGLAIINSIGGNMSRERFFKALARMS